MRIATILFIAAALHAQTASEHFYQGQPPGYGYMERQGYVVKYSDEHKIPLWVAYRIEPDYLIGKPERKGLFAEFNPDPDVETPVWSDDYTHSGYARGHMAPYAVMGGDRDGDGLYAKDGDRDDQMTAWESNLTTNITPQLHSSFNGAGGLWYKLETRNRNRVKGGETLWVVAGVVLGQKHERVTVWRRKGDHHWNTHGPVVPPMFFKVVYSETGEPTAYLFPHQRQRRGDLDDFIVAVEIIEQLTGLELQWGK